VEGIGVFCSRVSPYAPFTYAKLFFQIGLVQIHIATDSETRLTANAGALSST